MRKLLAALMVLGVLIAPCFAAISMPSNSVVSPVDMNPTRDGYQGYLYVPRVNGAHEVEIVDISDVVPSRVDTITGLDLGGTPRGMAISSNGQRIYVSISSTSSIKCYNHLGAEQWVCDAPSGGGFGGLRQIAISPDDKLLYVVDTSAQVIRVIRASNGRHISDISIAGVTGLYGVAVSPDNTMLAVIRRSSAGRLYVFDLEISYQADGTTVDTVTATPRAGSPVSSGLVWPTYVLFSPDNSRIYVRNNDGTSGSDVKVYNAVGAIPEIRDIAIGGSDQDPNNRRSEALAVSANGLYIYVTHYRASNGRVHFYSINTEDLATDGGPVPAWTVNDAFPNILPSRDGLAFEPDGSRVWITSSDDGDYTKSNWTGYTNGSGDLEDAIPGAPTFIHPVLTDDLANYTGNAQWTRPWDDIADATLHYRVNYKREGGTWTTDAVTPDWNWITDDPADDASRTAALSTYLEPGITYKVRVQANDGANWGPYAYSDWFTTAGPQIDHIEVQAVEGGPYEVTDEACIGYTVRIIGSGFGTRANGNGDSVDFNVQIGTHMLKDNNPDTAGPLEGGEIYRWESTPEHDEIIFFLPRSTTDAAFMEPSDTAALVVTAFGVTSDPYTFTINPRITTISPDEGMVGERSYVTGYGFGEARGISELRFTSDEGTVAAAIYDEWERRADDDRFRVAVPVGAITGPVVLVVNGQESNPVDFTVEAGGDVVITELQDPDGEVITDAFVYDTVVITGSGFGADPGEGDADTDTHNVTLTHATDYATGLRIRDGRDIGYEGLQVYEWSDTAIRIGIPRRISATFIAAGENLLTVTSPAGTSVPIPLNIRPRIYSVDPSFAEFGETPTIIISGTALHGASDISFGGTPAGPGLPVIPRENGDDPDGTGASDQLTVDAPAGLVAGEHAVVVTAASQLSNDDIAFEIREAGTPYAIRVIPNAAPTNSTVTVRVQGSGFSATPDSVVLSRGGATIPGAINSASATEINVTFDLTGAELGKWDVIVTNTGGVVGPTLENGFTVLPEGSEVAQIIDDFEGIAVTHPDGYEPFSSGGPITIDMSATAYPGDAGVQASEITFLASPLTHFRGFNATLNDEQDLSDFDRLAFTIQVDAPSTGTVKLQITGRLDDGSEANFAGIPEATYTAPLTDSTWATYTIPTSALREINDRGEEVLGGASFSAYAGRVVAYQLVFGGDDGTAAPVRVDYIRAEGYTEPGETGPITTTIVRDADTEGSSVTLSWVFNEGPPSAVDIYMNDEFSSDPADWTDAPVTVPDGTTTYTDAAQVGMGTQKYYKIVRSGAGLAEADLRVDVVGKFDISLEVGFNQVSIPLVQDPTDLVSVIGNQMTGGDFEFSADAIYQPNADGALESAWLHSSGNWYVPGTADTASPIAIDIRRGMYLLVNGMNGPSTVTFVGRVGNVPSVLTVAQGFILIGNPYPVEVEMSITGLFESGLKTGDLEFSASALFEPTGLDEDSDDAAWIHTTGNWYQSGSADTVTTIRLRPGVGYYLYNTEIMNEEPSFEWNYPRPY